MAKRAKSLMPTEKEIHMKQTIFGNTPSKSNCYKIITLGKHASLAKTPTLKKYENDFFIQCNYYRNKNIQGYFEIYIDVFYPSQRSDLDNSLKVVLDCLQKVKAIENDNKCVKILAQKFLDKENPRIEFELKEI
jgi:Holliday junction resolvase RusA-like endonuclease